jgi:hypothetical protein
VLTSNRGFSDWGGVFADEIVAAAILDRLHHATVVNIKGKGYRIRRYQAQRDKEKAPSTPFTFTRNMVSGACSCARKRHASEAQSKTPTERRSRRSSGG